MDELLAGVWSGCFVPWWYFYAKRNLLRIQKTEWIWSLANDFERSKIPEPSACRQIWTGFNPYAQLFQVVERDLAI
jgi:hypothetical protein